jgi:hypothetical protein
MKRLIVVAAFAGIIFTLNGCAVYAEPYAYPGYAPYGVGYPVYGYYGFEPRFYGRGGWGRRR